jgi:predicted anti-sigma-YlaC factor YlaD
MGIPCERFTEALSLWIDGQLGESEVQQMETHMSACCSCRAVSNVLRHVDRVLVTAPMVSPMPGFAARFQSRLAARRNRRRTLMGLIVLVLATTFLMMATSGTLIFSGLEMWQGVSTGDLIGQGVRIVLSFGMAVATCFNIALVVWRALEQAMSHPVFMGYAVVTALLAAAWAWVVGSRTHVHNGLPVGWSK